MGSNFTARIDILFNFLDKSDTPSIPVEVTEFSEEFR
jgi:hypothetical protein